MRWVVLVLAGLLEVAWATALPRLGEPLPTVVFAIAMAGSVGGLAWAVQEIPLGVGYAVWVGIGAVGTAIASAVTTGRPLLPAQWLFLAVVLVGVIGLRFVTPPHG